MTAQPPCARCGQVHVGTWVHRRFDGQGYHAPTTGRTYPTRAEAVQAVCDWHREWRQ